MELTKEEVKRLINENLDRLSMSTFDENYHMDLINLVGSIEVLLDRVYGNIWELEEKYSGFGDDAHRERILGGCDCIGTLCKTLKQKIETADFIAVNNLKDWHGTLN